ncbi:hypothetical protein R3W88_026768 [Solanum pinnatisectum]|uniref:Uncharacterized protein n=1 Tax=Solanum pinnatisectum TaxID=50273 RepID=A0AAV9LF51_9SOLN|nr:hypothetical protein R3W88_026768 [Solanum pinnatisectum]
MQYTNREDGNTSSQYQQHQKKEITTSQLMKNGRLRRGAYWAIQHSIDRPKSPKETLQQHQTHHTCMTTNFALPTSNNFIDLSMQNQPNNQEGAENQNSKNKDTMETQTNNKSTTDLPSTANQLSNNSDKEKNEKILKIKANRSQVFTLLLPYPITPLLIVWMRLLKLLEGWKEGVRRT